MQMSCDVTTLYFSNEYFPDSNIRSLLTWALPRAAFYV